MTDQEKIETLTAALKFASEAFHMLSEYDAHEVETTKMICAREARRAAEVLAQVGG